MNEKGFLPPPDNRCVDCFNRVVSNPEGWLENARWSTDETLLKVHWARQRPDGSLDVICGKVIV